MQIRIDEKLLVRELAEAQSTDMTGRSPSQQCCRTTGPVPRSPRGNGVARREAGPLKALTLAAAQDGLNGGRCQVTPAQYGVRPIHRDVPAFLRSQAG